jgi:NDP-sugar pyrophosphorylase family protein
VPLLGQSLLEYWLTHLAGSGVREVLILADDRPDQVRALIAGGVRWGLKATVLDQSRELTPAQALLKYEKELDPASTEKSIIVIEHFPGLPDNPLFSSFPEFFAALLAWMPSANTLDRVGIHQEGSNVWTGLNSRISPDAQLRGPCWLGRNVFLGSRAMVGPGSILEDGAFIEPGATIVNSLIGPYTFVGRFAEIADSIAQGSTLLNWKTGSMMTVPDPFLLCALRPTRSTLGVGWFARLTDIYTRNKEDVHDLWKHLLLNKEG